MIDYKKDIENIGISLRTLKSFKPEAYAQQFLQLVDCRRRLRTMQTAAENNPGIAAFGKSQVGKSYLINCLLQDKGKHFMVKSNNDEYDFVLHINPPSEEGGGRESTGVVSRFSSFKRRPDIYSQQYPVLVKTFSLTDIILILADSYYNDSDHDQLLSEDEVDSLATNLIEQYGNNQPIASPVIAADDVLYMKEYFMHHIKRASVFYQKPFFDKLAFVVENIMPTDYITVFGKLWKDNPNMTRLYKKLYDILKRINFAPYIYLPIGAVLHEGIRENTIMSVQCLKELLDQKGSSRTTDVYIMEDGKVIPCDKSVPKSHVCAICSEVIYKIEESFLSSTSRYDMRGIPDETKQRIRQDEIQMKMLQDNDLLDFPGARSRLKTKIETLDEDDVLLNCYLRGKVAYLFNKYNEDKIINILLYCHHNKDNDVSDLYLMLEDWVNNYVGKTPEERRRKIDATGLSPLFYIGTMFNLDMTVGPGIDADTISDKAIDQRWLGRFHTVVNNQCFHRDEVQWVRNWTREGENFNNSYVIRDYAYSGEKTGLYRGFRETGKEQSMIMSQAYYNRMRDTFINNEHVRTLFRDPAVAWDLTASIGNDGALYIMENLATVAQRMMNSREQDFIEARKHIMERVYTIMKGHYVSDDTSEILEANIRKADAIFRDIEFTCEASPDYFGHLIQALQLSESNCYNIIHKLIPNLTSIVVGDSHIKDYQLIRRRCNNFEGAETEEEKWKILISSYRFSNRDEAYAYLQARGIETDKLFAGSHIKRTNSAIITDQLLTQWKNALDDQQFQNAFGGEGRVDPISLTALIDCIKSSANDLGLAEKIENEISQYTDISNTNDINSSLVADIIATTVSDFVTDFGYSYLSPKQIESARRVAKEHNLPCFDWIERERQEEYDEDQLTELFDRILKSSDKHTEAYKAHLQSWIEYLYIAYIAHLNVPNINREFNDKLKQILKELSDSMNNA